MVKMGLSENQNFVKDLHPIKIVGTIHISESAKNIVKELIEEWKPNAIMLELDDLRMQAFESESFTKTFENGKDEPDNDEDLDGVGFLKEMEKLQSDISATLSENIGEEMKTAIMMAKAKKIPVFPIDKSIEEIAAELQLKLTPKKKKDLKKRIQEEVASGSIKEQYQDLIEKIQSPEGLMEIINDLKSEFPEIIESLLTDRNQYMVNQILSYHREHADQKLLVIVGLAHLHEIYDLLKQKI